ncbi:MAG: SDR family NAD(P)-dependent oxidoreductase, partial [Actinomycetota bacterium]
LIGGDALGLGIDVNDRASIRAVVDATVERFGGLDVLVCNAGVTIVGSVMDLTEDEWDKELDTNLKSVFLCAKEAWDHLAARGGGSILSTASMAGQWAIPADAAYCASKAGLIMLTKCMALDGAKQNIRANCVCPGFTNTPMIDGYFDAQDDPDASRRFAIGLHPLGRMGEPLDHANAFVYLASDEASWVTGLELNVDGGITCGIWGG